MKRFLLIVSTVLFLGSVENYYRVENNKIETASAAVTSNTYGIKTASNSISEKYGSWKKSYSHKYTTYYIGGNSTNYLEKGISSGKVQKLTILGKSLSVDGIKYGMTLSSVKKKFSIKKSITAKSGNRKIVVTNSKTTARPLIYNKGLFYELHVDTTTSKVLGVTLYTFDGFLLERPYAFTYYGTSKLAASKAIPKTAKFNNAMSDQTFAVTNVVRKLYSKTTLKQQNSLETVADKHSADMNKYNYFAHNSPKGSTLAKRLKNGKISYKTAGENLAYNYSDGVRAVTGWLNSSGHRKNLLNNNFSKMGIGVYGKYVTQNFIK